MPTYSSGMTVATRPIGAGHPAIDSGIDICRAFAGSRLVQLQDHGTEWIGQGRGGPAAVVHDDDSLVAWFAWRWVGHRGRWLLGWWYGDGDGDYLSIVAAGDYLWEYCAADAAEELRCHD